MLSINDLQQVAKRTNIAAAKHGCRLRAKVVVIGNDDKLRAQIIYTEWDYPNMVAKKIGDFPSQYPAIIESL